MSNNIKITFAKSSTVKGGLSVLLAGKDGQFSQDALSADPDGITAHAMKVAEYNMTVLNPLWMGRYLANVVLKRDENLPDLKKIREGMKAYV